MTVSPALTTPNPNTISELPLTIAVDAEHSGIRMVGCGVLFATFAAILLIVNALSPNSILLAGFIALIGSALVTSLVDRALKGRWASGRFISIRPEEIAIQNKGTTEIALNPQKQLNPLLWYFVVKRNGRVKKGWHVIGFALEQDETYIPVYSFCAPDDFEKLPLHKQFTKLEKQTTQDENMKLAGIQRRLHIAESQRGIYGAEMPFDQFIHYLQTLEQNFPTWMPKS
jgi:hypothetical protein